jgi:signal transduction histidine kinase
MISWRSLRVRLTAGFVLFAGVTIAIAAVAVVRLVEQLTLGALDTVLLEEATTLATLVDEPAATLERTIHEVAAEPEIAGRKFVAVIAADGSKIAASKRIPRAVARERRREGTFTAGEDNHMYRVASVRTAAGGEVMVGVHGTGLVRLMRRTRWVTGLVGGGLLAVLGLGAWAFTGRATREIDRLAGEIETIEAGTLERRLSARHTVEVDRLVAVLNRVLARLERSVGQMRRFSADAAHELRTPIAALRARLEISLRRDGDVPRDVVLDALEQAERLGHLAEDLLTLTRLEGGAVAASAVDTVILLEDVAAEVAATMLPLAEEQGRRFGWACAPGLRVRGSEPLLKRVVVNLIDNALRHTPATADVQLRIERDGDCAAIVVQDAGEGVAAEIRPHVFERFRHGPGTGSGLGLALVREIATRHAGTVTLESDPGAGTLVRVRLPLVRPDSHPPARSDDVTPARGEPGRQPRAHVRGTGG